MKEEDLTRHLDRLNNLIKGNKFLMIQALGIVLLGRDLQKEQDEIDRLKDPTTILLEGGVRIPNL